MVSNTCIVCLQYTIISNNVQWGHVMVHIVGDQCKWCLPNLEWLKTDQIDEILQANMKMERSSMSMTLDLNSGTIFWLLFCDILTTLLKRFKTITSLRLCTGMSSEQSIYLLLYRNGCLVIFFFYKHLSRNCWFFQKVNYVLIYTFVMCR